MWGKRGKTSGPNMLNFPMVWLRPSGEKPEQAEGGKQLEGGGSQGETAYNDGANRGKDGENDAEKQKDYNIDVSRFVRNQLPIKLEFKIPRNTKVFNCAATHKEWFLELKKKDPSARSITNREAAIS